MASFVLSLLLCIAGFVLIWLGINDGNSVMSAIGGLLFGGSTVLGVYHRP